MSTYRPNSLISRINRGEENVVVDDQFKKVFDLAQQIHKDTDGYFDPTVGILVDAYGFGAQEAVEVTDELRDSLLQYVGFDKLSLKQNVLLKANTNTQFDFNAIAKGYTLDLIALYLTQTGGANYLIELGGEIVAKGQNLDSLRAWTVGIDDPQRFEERVLKQKIQFSDKAMASSGNYRKFRVDEKGNKYVHTIDPFTGKAKISNVLATSVIADDCATADAWATSFMVMDLPKSLSILKGRSDLWAYIIYSDEQGEIKEWFSPEFEALLID
jgi:thiamine biosynthesis lipoprotein